MVPSLKNNYLGLLWKSQIRASGILILLLSLPFHSDNDGSNSFYILLRYLLFASVGSFSMYMVALHLIVYLHLFQCELGNVVDSFLTFSFADIHEYFCFLMPEFFK